MDQERARGDVEPDLDQKRGRKPEKSKTRKKSKPTPGHQVRTAVTVDTIADQAAAIFDALGYRGNQGGNLWGVAALLESGIGDLSEAEVFSACRGAKLNGHDPPAHFFATMSESLQKRGENLTQRLREVTIVPDWPRAHPRTLETARHTAPRKEKPRSLDDQPSVDEARDQARRSIANKPDPIATERTQDDIRRELEAATGEGIDL
jgi:hypothetical protein